MLGPYRNSSPLGLLAEVEVTMFDEIVTTPVPPALKITPPLVRLMLKAPLMVSAVALVFRRRAYALEAAASVTFAPAGWSTMSLTPDVSMLLLL